MSGEGLLGSGQTLFGVLATLFVLCMFPNESNFIIQFAISIAKGRSSYVAIYQARILCRFTVLVEQIDKLLEANNAAKEVNDDAKTLRNAIDGGMIDAQKENVSYAFRINDLSMKLMQRHVPVLLYLFLYAIIILACDAIPGQITSCSYLFALCFSLLSIVFCSFLWLHTPRTDSSSVNNRTQSWGLFMAGLAFVAGQGVLKYLENTDLFVYLVITFVPLFLFSWSMLNLLKNRIFIDETLSREFVALSVLAIIVLSIVPAACYYFLFQKYVLLFEFIHYSIPFFRIGIIFFVLLAGLIIPLFTPLIYGYGNYCRRCHKVSAKYLNPLKSRFSDLKERYKSLPH